jgi:pSer/pThr/pTyr-binding forkhead associated (FHA) protein
VIVCPRCSKENQDHYKFCLGCGAELPRDAAKKDFVAARVSATDPPAAPIRAPEPAPAGAAAPRYDRNMQFAATQQGDVSVMPNPPSGTAATAPAPVATRGPAPAPAPAAGAASGAASGASGAPAVHSCPACGNPVPADFKFCGTCGHRLGGGGGNAGAGVAPASPQVSAVPQPGAAARGQLVLINPDGSEGASFALADGPTPVGRNSGRLFAQDAYLSPKHATFLLGPKGCTVRDEQSLNGVYVKIARDKPMRINHGDIFRIGQEIIRFETIAPTQSVDGVEPMGSPNPGFIGRICLLIGRQSSGNVHVIQPDGMHIGRERGDVIFPEDGYVSGLHCRIHHDGSGVVLTDVGSSNGTFMRVRGETTVQNGDLLLLGQQLFRLAV